MTNDTQQTAVTLTEEQQLEALMNINSLVLQFAFVPYSRSRHAGTWESLNYKVDVLKGSTAILQGIDYGVGIASCPGYKPGRRTLDVDAAIKFEIEHGRRSGPFGTHGRPLPPPKQVNTMASLLMDASVLRYPSFESWATEYGYDTDSRKAEASYRECLRVGLALQHAFRSVDEFYEAIDLAYQL